MKSPLTDAPWFWVLLFSSCALVFLLAIWPQYLARQRRLEMQYLAREEIVRRRAAGEDTAREAGAEGDAAPPAAGELIIPLWPLAAVFAALTALSGTMLWRSRQGDGTIGETTSRGPA